MTSSVIITCTYPFTADDNNLQKSTILSSAICHYTGHQDMTSTQVSPILSEKLTRTEIIWNFCVIRLLYPASAHNLIIYFISFEELSYVDCQNVAQYTIKTSQIHFTDKPCRVVEILGIRNDAIHEPIPGHQLFLWQNAVSDLYMFDHQWVNISLGSMLERFHTTIKGGSLWDLKLFEMRVLAI